MKKKFLTILVLLTAVLLLVVSGGWVSGATESTYNEAWERCRDEFAEESRSDVLRPCPTIRKFKTCIKERIRELEELKKSQQSWRKWKKEIKPTMRPATKEDYESWLSGYFQSASKNSLIRFSVGSIDALLSDFYYIAKEDFRMLYLSTGYSVNVIVPHGVRFLGGELGGSKLYFMEGFKVLPEDAIPVIYEDMSF